MGKAFLYGTGGGGGDNSAAVIKGTITAFTDKASDITELRDYAFYDCKLLTETDLPVCGKIGNNAYYQCSALKKAKGFTSPLTIGKHAFSGCVKFEGIDFSDINVTSLGENAFYMAGNTRDNPSTNRLVFDLSKSSFSVLESNTFAGTSANKTAYVDIHLPETLGIIRTLAFAYTDNIRLYFNSLKAPTLPSGAFQNTTNFTAFVPWGGLNDYKTATNWITYAANVIGRMKAGELNVGDALPTVNAEGYSLTWYSDVERTTVVTTVADADAEYYCELGEQLADYFAFKSASATESVISVVGANNKKYIVGEGIPSGETLTITTSAATAGYVPYLLTVNGVAFTSGDTLTVAANLEIVSIYYDGEHAPVDPVFNNNSWAVIRKVFRDGDAATYWNLGDVKQVALSDGYTYGVQIVDMTAGRYLLSAGGGSSNGVLQFVKCLATSRQMNTSNTNVGGWAECAMRTALNTTVYNQLPADLKAVISEVSIASGIGNSTTSGTTDSDNKLFLASEYEIFGAKTYSIGTSEGSPQFGYWALHNSNADRIKTKINDSSATWWWLRSPRSGDSAGFGAVYNGGVANYYGAYDSGGVCPCFAI